MGGGGQPYGGGEEFVAVDLLAASFDADAGVFVHTVVAHLAGLLIDCLAFGVARGGPCNGGVAVEDLVALGAHTAGPLACLAQHPLGQGLFDPQVAADVADVVVSGFEVLTEVVVPVAAGGAGGPEGVGGLIAQTCADG